MTVIFVQYLLYKMGATLEEHAGIETHYYCRREISACIIVDSVMEFVLFT